MILNQLVIRKSNALIEATHKLSLSEQRLLILLASSISLDDDDFREYELTVSKFAEMFELELNGSLYEALERSVLSLMKQQVIFRDDDVKDQIMVVQWVSVATYVPRSGVVKLKFDSVLKPHLLQLRERFTQYLFDSVVRLRGQYSPRIYELLKKESFKAKGGVFSLCFQVDEFRTILGIESTAYPIFNNFKVRVIEPSVNEISLSSDLIINEVKYGKTGRKITNMTFIVTVRYSKDESKTVKPVQTTHEVKALTPKQETDCPVINMLVAHGINPIIAKRFKANYDADRIQRNLAYTITKKQNGEIKTSFAGYLKSAIEADYSSVNQTNLFDIVKKVAIVAEKKDKKDKKDDKSSVNVAFSNFLLLPEVEQENLKALFYEQSDDTIKAKIKEQERREVDFFSSPFVEKPFKVFLSKRSA